MKKRVLSALVFCVLLLSLCAPFDGAEVIAAADREPQFSIAFEKDGAFKNLDGNAIDLPESSRIAVLEEVKLGFEMWHHHSEASPGDYWKWTAGDASGRIYIKSSPGIEGIMPNYSNFDDLMRRSGARLTTRIRFPEEVQNIVDSGRRVVVVISAGNALDVDESEQYTLDIDRMFPFGIGWSEDLLAADEQGLTIRLPVRFNFMREDPDSHESPVISFQKASATVAEQGENRIIQKDPGLPIPEFGYGRVLGAIKHRSDKSGEERTGLTEAGGDGTDVGLGSRQIHYADREGKYAFNHSSPGPGGPWWIGDLRTERKPEADKEPDKESGKELGKQADKEPDKQPDKQADKESDKETDDSLIVLDPQFDEDHVHNYEDSRYLGKNVSIGVKGGANQLAAVGAMFYYPLVIEFYLAEPENLSVSAENIICSELPGETVDLGFLVSSTFLEQQETDYVITINGATIAANSLIVPPVGKEEVPFSFIMPEHDITVAFAVNPGGDKPPEENITDNSLELYITAAIPVEMTGDISLDYDVLTQIESFSIGETTAKLSLPALSDAAWTAEPAKVSLVVTNATPELYHEFEVEGGIRNADDTNSFTIEMSTVEEEITLDPLVRVKIIRDWDNYLDDPLNGDYGENDVQDSITPPTGKITAKGEVSRQYTYVEFVSEWEYNTETKRHEMSSWNQTRTGTVTATFSVVNNYKSIVIYVYNGDVDLAFTKTLQNEAAITAVLNKGVQYSLLWEGAPIRLDTVRWMNHRDENGNVTRWESADGQFERTFVGQSSGSVTWETRLSQEAGYRADRDAAREGKTGRGNYTSAVFATDKHLQGSEFPIKAGYYFNPLGVYTSTVKTVQYMETDGPTDEHKDLVELVAAAFRYSSDLEYVTSGGGSTRLQNVSEANGRSVLKVSTGTTRIRATRLETTSARTGTVDALQREAMEGYPESGTDASRAVYKYRERTGKAIYLVEEETVVTFVVAPLSGRNMYTHANMPNGSYAIRAWMDTFVFAGSEENPVELTAGASGSFDRITVTVKGSMYDDR